MSDYRLHQALSALHAGIQTLASEDTDLTVDPAEYLDATTADVEAALLGVLRSARQAEAQADAAKKMAADITARAQRFAARNERLRGIALAAMDALGKRKIEAPDMTVTMRDGARSVWVSDETAVPPEYWTTPAPALDRKKLADDLKHGVVIDGASLSNGLPQIQIRTR